MGDDAWLWKLDCEFRLFNYVGDLHTISGTVTRKYLADGDRPAVDLELAATNQRGEVTAPGHASILLPSRRTRSGSTPRSTRRVDQPDRAADRGIGGIRRALTAMSYDNVDGLRAEQRGPGTRVDPRPC